MADRSLLDRALVARVPVSDRLATRDTGWHFWIDVALWPEREGTFWWSDELGAIVVGELVDGGLRVYDVIAPALPDVSEIAACFGVSSLELYLTPDRLSSESGSSKPCPLEDVMMVRGALPGLAQPFALSPLCRC